MHGTSARPLCQQIARHLDSLANPSPISCFRSGAGISLTARAAYGSRQMICFCKEKQITHFDPSRVVVPREGSGRQHYFPSSVACLALALVLSVFSSHSGFHDASVSTASLTILVNIQHISGEASSRHFQEKRKIKEKKNVINYRRLGL